MRGLMQAAAATVAMICLAGCGDNPVRLEARAEAAEVQATSESPKSDEVSKVMENYLHRLERYQRDTRDRPQVKLYQWLVRQQFENLDRNERQAVSTETRDDYFEQAADVIEGFINAAYVDGQVGAADEARGSLARLCFQEIRYLRKRLNGLPRGSQTTEQRVEQEDIVGRGSRYVGRLRRLRDMDGAGAGLRAEVEDALSWTAECGGSFGVAAGEVRGVAGRARGAYDCFEGEVQKIAD